jgi:predicted molibdopterin-dependent oxidoreductase YjgC
MFQSLVVGWADLVLPGTSYLERDGTFVNLEGRLQRLRRAVVPPAPDELAWISRLAERFGVDISPHPSVVFGEVSERIFGGLPYGEVGERADLRGREPLGKVERPAALPVPKGPGLRLVRYRPLFSGAAVERVPELAFQRPAPEVELSPVDARRLKIAAGEDVTVRSNGTSRRLRARLDGRLAAGVVRVAQVHSEGLLGTVEVTRS